MPVARVTAQPLTACFGGRRVKVTLRMPRAGRVSGTSRYSHALAEALAQQGVDVTKEEERKVEVRLGKLWLGGGLSARLARWVPPRKADIVHATTPYCNPRRAADVVTVHDIMPLTHPHLYGMSEASIENVRQTVGRALGRHILVQTQATKHEVLRSFPAATDGRIHVVPLGVDHANFHPDPAPVAGAADPALRRGMLNVVAVLPSERRKRIDLLLEAASQLPFVRIVHVAGGPVPPGHRAMEEATLPMRQRLEAAGRYVRLGEVGDERLRRLYSSAGLMAHPTEAEGFGWPPLEALACGAPVLASDVPAMREVLGEAARYVPLTAAAWQRTLQEAWDGQAVRAERFMPQADRVRHAQSYTWARTASGTLAAYRAALADRRA